MTNQVQEKVMAKVDNCSIKVVERIAKKSGKPYRVVVAVIKGKECNIGFLDNNVELNMIHAGIVFNY